MTTLDASIVICTHDRAQVVGTAVRGALAAARDAAAEVIVVDNASSDATPAVLDELARAEPALRVVRHETLGLSAARNRGLAEARGRIVVYLDDDAVPHPGWLPALLEPYAHPVVACVGGPLVLRFEGTPPSWLTSAFHPAAGAFDLGPSPRTLTTRPGDFFPCGANISFRRETAIALGGFSTLVGAHGRQQMTHEETDLCARITRSGHQVRYVPTAVVDHWVVADKLTPRYFLSRQLRFGQSTAIYLLRNRSLLRVLIGARWYLRLLLRAPYEPHDPIDPERLLAECQRREALGYLGSLARNLPKLARLRTDEPLARPSLPA